MKEQLSTFRFIQRLAIAFFIGYIVGLISYSVQNWLTDDWKDVDLYASANTTAMIVVGVPLIVDAIQYIEGRQRQIGLFE